MLVAISIVPLLVAALCGVVTTADCLSREKRDRTLDLLLLTRLHPIEIVFHKLLATTAPVFSGLLAIAPLTLIAVSVGGVSGAEAIAVGILTVTTALLSAAFGILVSSVTKSIFTAMLTTFCLSSLFFGSCLFPSVQAGTSVFTMILKLANPFDLLRPIFLDPLANVVFSEVILTAVMSIAAALCLLLLSALLLPHASSTALGIVRMRPRLEPIVTLACVILSPLLLVLCIFAQSVVPLLTLATLVAALAKLIVLASAVRILNMRPWLELVLTTPLPPAEYIRAELIRFCPRILYVLVLCFASELVVLWRLPPGYRLFVATITIFLVLDALALGLVGLWNGLRFRNLSEAMSFSLSSVLLVPIAIAGILMAVGFRTETIAGGVLLWALLCLAVDALAAASANWMLQHRLRQVASL